MFASPVAWMVLGLMQAVLAWLFFAQLDAYLAVQNQLVNLANPPGFTELVVKPAFETSRFVLLMATPILSMRLIAEERRNQTMALLLSAPISMTQIALGIEQFEVARYAGAIARLDALQSFVLSLLRGSQRLHCLGFFGGLIWMLALSLNLIWGGAGMVNLGLAGFFAVGAYASALVTTQAHAAIPVGWILALVAGGH